MSGTIYSYKLEFLIRLKVVLFKMNDGNVKHPLIAKRQSVSKVHLRKSHYVQEMTVRVSSHPFLKTEINQHKFTQVQSSVTSTTRVKMRGSGRDGYELRSHPRIVPLTKYLTHSHSNTSKYADVSLN